MLASGRIDPALYRNGLQFALAEYLASQQPSKHRQSNILDNNRPSITSFSTLAGALDEPKPALPTQDSTRPSALNSNATTPPPPHCVPVAGIPIRGRQTSDDSHRWTSLTPPSLSSSPSDGWTIDATSPAWSDYSNMGAPSPSSFEEKTSIGDEQVSHSLPTKRTLPPCFTTEPLVRSLSSSASPPQAPSRREGTATRKCSPYRVPSLERKKPKEETLDADLEARYDALVEEAMKDPANKYYRREVIERAIRGADYHPKTKAKIRKQSDASDRPTRKRSRKRGDARPTTAQTSHALTQEFGHDHAEHLLRQQVEERQTLVHRPEQLELIDNRGHPVSGIAKVSPDHFNLFTEEQGQECTALGLLENTWTNPTKPCFDPYGQLFDLAVSLPMPTTVHPNSSQNGVIGSWANPNLNMFGNPGSSTTADGWDLSTSPSIGPFDPVETTWSWWG